MQCLAFSNRSMSTEEVVEFLQSFAPILDHVDDSIMRKVIDEDDEILFLYK